MSNYVVINTALRLPAPDIEALLQGRVIVAMPQKFITPGRQFALCPTDASISLLPAKQYYHSSFLSIAQSALTQLDTETVSIKAWARCELCQILNQSEFLSALSQLTIWTTEALQKILTQRQNIFLAYLRVYQLPEQVKVTVKSNSQFIALPQPLTVSEVKPVLSDRLFAIRKRQLENREPPPHPELEDLQSAIAQLNNPSAQQLEHEIKKLLGWTSETLPQAPDLQPAWINTIADLGNRSKEQDTGKSNYQAGTDFENVVRDSLKFLGFTIDCVHKGGAGGLDLFCSKPYPLIGECKAGKKIPNDTAVQLLNLGTLRLNSEEQFRKSAKLIIGAGKPTEQLEDAAKVHGMAIISPETLEKLVKLQSQYRGSVDLLKLRTCLKPGRSDDEVEKYITQVESEITLRVHLIQLVQKYLESTGLETVGVDALHGAYFGSNPPQPLPLKQMHEILIELSSPLTGYLGRTKGNDWQSDRFYFLRNLPID